MWSRPVRFHAAPVPPPAGDVSRRVDAHSDLHRSRPHSTFFPDLLITRIQHHVRKLGVPQPSRGEGLQEVIELGHHVRDGSVRKRVSTQPFRQHAHFARRRPAHVHLGEDRYQGLFRPPITLEDLGIEVTVTVLRHP